MERTIRSRKPEEHWIAGNIVKMAVLPSFCFAVLSTIAFEKAVYAAQTTPSQSAAANTVVDKYVNISGGILNLRSGASTSASVITGLKKGTEVTVLSNIDGWSSVKVNGLTGYVSSLYLTTANTATNNSSAAQTGAMKYVNVSIGSLNLRSSASTSASVITSLKKGTEVTVLSEKSGWSSVEVNGLTGYVSSQYLSAANQNTVTNNSSAALTEVIKYVNVSSGLLNLRSGASTSASVISTLAKGTSVTVYSQASGWSKVSANGKEGYVSSSFLSSSNPNAGTALAQNTGNSTSTTNKPPASTATAPSSSAVTKYVNVSSGSLNMRNGASTSASIIVKLANGTSVKVFSEAGGWTEIAAYGQTGFVSSQYLTSTPASSGNSTQTQGTASKYVNVNSASSLNLRESASSSSAILAQIPNGAQVVVYSDSNGWSKVTYNGQAGYVNSEFLSNSIANNNNTDQQTIVKYVNVDLGSSLNMRKYATTSSSILVKLSRGIQVTVDAEADGWSKIEAYGQVGYVNSSYLSAVKPVPGSNSTSDNSAAANDGASTEEFVNVIYGSSLNMRSSAATNATVVTKLARGTIVTVISEADGWTKVSANGLTGYVSSQYLSTTQPVDPITTNDSTVITYDSYNISLSDMIQIQTAALPQTDKQYNTYIRADALTLTSPSSGTVNGTGWNVRGGAGSNYWVVGAVNNHDNLQIVSKVKGTDGYDWYQVNYNKTWVNASPDDIAYYVNPSNFLNSPVDSLQFLKLSESANIDAGEVNSRILADKGSLQGMASAFITAGNQYSVNEIYLISHALLETADGTSRLASGVQFNNKTVYNMYGIGAVDSNPIASGAQFAYNAGWYTPEEAIIGGAQFIAKGYIDAGQDTLYKMRWNPDGAAADGSATHQYATDIGWAEKQVVEINNLYSLLDTYKLVFEIPQFK